MGYREQDTHMNKAAREKLGYIAQNVANPKKARAEALIQQDVNDYKHFLRTTNIPLDTKVHTMDWFLSRHQTSPKQGYFKFLEDMGQDPRNPDPLYDWEEAYAQGYADYEETYTRGFPTALMHELNPKRYEERFVEVHKDVNGKSVPYQQGYWWDRKTWKEVSKEEVMLQKMQREEHKDNIIK